jgi:hypothetical protein
MYPVRSLLAASLVAIILPSVFAQESGASRASVETRPDSRPAEIRAHHPRIGVRCETTTLEQEHVARVESIKPGSPAEKAGIRVGDVILKIGADEIRDDKTYRDSMAKRKPGETLSVTLRRGAEQQTVEVTLVDKLPRTEPESVWVQHILIGCGDKAPNPTAKKRTVDEARKRAEDLAAKAKNGADFGELVKNYSEDAGSKSLSPPGVIKLVLDGKPKLTADQSEYSGMVLGFSAVAFGLEVGDVAITPYDAEIAPYGFHVIKRIK